MTLERLQDLTRLVKGQRVLILGMTETTLMDNLEAQGKAVIGITSDEEFAYNVYHGGRDNVFLMNEENVTAIIGENSFDTVILDDTLHEVFSRVRNSEEVVNESIDRIKAGRAVISMLSDLFEIIKDDGRIVIRDIADVAEEFRYDFVSLKTSDSLIKFLENYAKFERNQKNPIVVQEERTVMQLNTFIDVANNYAYHTNDMKYNFLTVDDLRIWSQEMGFTKFHVDLYVDEVVEDVAKLFDFYNLVHENILPHTDFIAVIEK